MRDRRSSCAFVALVVLSGCATVEPVPEIDLTATRLPLAAAEYTTTRRIDDEHAHGEVQTTQWRFWRNTDRVETENLSSRIGEIWQRDGAAVFHQRLYHMDRRGIEFQPDDLRMVSSRLSWPTQSLGVDPALLKQLTLERVGWTRGKDAYPYRRYRGESAGYAWKVVMRTDLMLPVDIERKREGFSERTRVEQAHALSSAPWQPIVSDGYELIDFADLGDRENDPFVVKVERDLGRPHAH